MFGIEMSDIWNSARLWQGVCAYLIVLLLILSNIEDRHLRKAQKTTQQSSPHHLRALRWLQFRDRTTRAIRNTPRQAHMMFVHDGIQNSNKVTIRLTLRIPTALSGCYHGLYTTSKRNRRLQCEIRNLRCAELGATWAVADTINRDD